MHTLFLIVATIAIALQGLSLYLALFGPDLPYQVKQAPDAPIDSAEFRDLMAALTQAEIQPGNRIEVLTNGDRFYEAELQAIQSLSAL